MLLPRSPKHAPQLCKVVGGQEWWPLLAALWAQLLTAQQNPPPPLALGDGDALGAQAREDCAHVLLKVQRSHLCSIKKILHIALQHCPIHILFLQPTFCQVTLPPFALL